MVCFLDFTTLIANLVTIAGLVSGFIYIARMIKLKSNPKIYIDSNGNLKTKRKKLCKIILRLIKVENMVDSLEIITQNEKKIKGNSVGISAINKMFELNNIQKERFIKRGINIIISQAITDFTVLGFISVITLDQLLIDYINVVKNKGKQPKNVEIMIDVFLTIDKGYDIRTILYLTKDEGEKLKDIIKSRDSIIPYIDINDLNDIDVNLIKTAVLGLILQCSLNDKLWVKNEFIFKEKLPLILNKFSWQVGLS